MTQVPLQYSESTPINWDEHQATAPGYGKRGNLSALATLQRDPYVYRDESGIPLVREMSSETDALAKQYADEQQRANASYQDLSAKGFAQLGSQDNENVKDTSLVKWDDEYGWYTPLYNLQPKNSLINKIINTVTPMVGMAAIGNAFMLPFNAPTQAGMIAAQDAGMAGSGLTVAESMPGALSQASQAAVWAKPLAQSLGKKALFNTVSGKPVDAGISPLSLASQAFKYS